MDRWTLPELVTEAAQRIEALPAPTNGQIRAVPDERTIRYYAAIGLVDRPLAMRGRTALYGRRHLAQVVAIKRLQGAGHRLADIQAMWPTLDDRTLERMSGVEVVVPARSARKDFWKRPAIPAPHQSTHADGGLPWHIVSPAPRGAGTPAMPIAPTAAGGEAAPPVALRIELAPEVTLVIGLPETASVAISPADVRAVRAAAAALVTELARRGLIAQELGTLEEP